MCPKNVPKEKALAEIVRKGLISLEPVVRIELTTY